MPLPLGPRTAIVAPLSTSRSRRRAPGGRRARPGRRRPVAPVPSERPPAAVGSPLGDERRAGGDRGEDDRERRGGALVLRTRDARGSGRSRRAASAAPRARRRPWRRTRRARSRRRTPPRRRRPGRRAGRRSRAGCGRERRRASPPPRAAPGSIERSAGVTIRTTNGAATSDCATGTSHHDERKSIGASSKAIRKPKPSITAEAPSGSSTSPSTTPGGRRARAIAASPPTASAIAAATPANAIEKTAACQGSTSSAGVSSNSVPQLPRDWSTRSASGKTSTSGAGGEHAGDRDALPAVRPAEHVVLVGERGCARRRGPRGCSPP